MTVVKISSGRTRADLTLRGERLRLEIYRTPSEGSARAERQRDTHHKAIATGRLQEQRVVDRSLSVHRQNVRQDLLHELGTYGLTPERLTRGEARNLNTLLDEAFGAVNDAAH